MSSMKNLSFLSLVLLLSVAFSSCKSKKTGSTVVSPEIKTISEYWNSQYSSDYLEARGKASITTNGKTTNVAMHLKMRKDSIIWGKFSMFGIGATVLITEDSFFMVNTLSQEYMAYDNSYLDQFLGFRASVTQVQNLLLGNAVFTESEYTFYPSEKELIARQGVGKNRIAINKQTRTAYSILTAQDSTQNALVQYDEYTSVGDFGVLPRAVSIDIRQGTTTLDVALNYQNINTNSIRKYPFKIPYGFTRK